MEQHVSAATAEGRIEKKVGCEATSFWSHCGGRSRKTLVVEQHVFPVTTEGGVEKDVSSGATCFCRNWGGRILILVDMQLSMTTMAKSGNI